MSIVLHHKLSFLNLEKKGKLKSKITTKQPKRLYHSMSSFVQYDDSNSIGTMYI